MGLRAIIVDDVEREARELASMVLASPLGCDAQVRTCSDVDALEDLLGVAGGIIDVVFMDVRLGERSGIDAIERLLPLGSPTQVVYVRGFDESHTRVYRTEHTSYLRKPLRQEDVSLALEQVRARQADVGANPVVLRHDHVVDFVRPRDIAYAESDRRHVLVHTRSGELRVYGKLSELEAQLPAPPAARSSQRSPLARRPTGRRPQTSSRPPATRRPPWAFSPPCPAARPFSAPRP